MLPNTFDDLIELDEVVIDTQNGYKIKASISKVEDVINTDDSLLDGTWLGYKNKWRAVERI